MPRANRYITAGRTYHVTHRCHNGAYLLRFAKDRDRYRRLLREQLKKHPVWVFGYCLTSNHVHLLLQADSKAALAGFMQCLAGDFAQAYNLRKKRHGAYWGDRYHATLVDGVRHLRNCIRYIDLNMVRAGVVAHPREWAWCGYHELVGDRKRFRLVDRDRLMEALGDGVDHESFSGSYATAIDEACHRGGLTREPMWTEAMAVGSESFVRRIEETLKNRRSSEIAEGSASAGAWVLRETSLYSGWMPFSG